MEEKKKMGERIGERLKGRRVELGITGVHMVSMLEKKGISITNSTYLRYESGKICTIPLNVIEALSEILNLDPTYLMGFDKVKSFNLDKSNKTIPIDVYKNLIKIDSINKTMSIGKVEIPKVWVASGEKYLAIKITESNMYPEYFVDDIVIIKVQKDFENGDVCAISIKGTKVTLREIYRKDEDKEIFLKSHNLFYPDLTLQENDIKILGVVKEIRRSK